MKRNNLSDGPFFFFQLSKATPGGGVLLSSHSSVCVCLVFYLETHNTYGPV